MNLQNNTFFSDHYVNVRGYKTRYWDVGFAESVVILIHGFSLSSEIWQNNIEILAKSHRVIALDFLGCGKTDATSKTIDIYEYPEFIIWFMDALKITKAKIIGHSLGGMIALSIMKKYPKYVEKLILVGSAGFSSQIPWYFRLLRLPYVSKFLVKPNKSAFKYILSRNTYAKNVLSDSLIDSLFEYAKKPSSIKQNLSMAKNALTMFGFRYALIHYIQDNARQIKCPVCVVWGKNDRILSYQGAFLAKKLIPHARIEIFEKCGHLPQIEYPSKFNEIAHSFLTSD